MNKQILIVEDDPDAAQSVADVLESEGYRTVLASNGLEALDHLNNGTRPDLILLDMMMPVMDGWTFRAEQLKTERLAAIPVVAMTADGNARAKAAAMSAASSVSKPLSVDSLVGVVRKLCGTPTGNGMSNGG